MRVKMLEDAPGSPDGVAVNQYDDGVVYEVTDALGAVFIAEGLAEEMPSAVDDPKPKRRGGRKSTTPAENK